MPRSGQSPELHAASRLRKRESGRCPTTYTTGDQRPLCLRFRRLFPLESCHCGPSHPREKKRLLVSLLSNVIDHAPAQLVRFSYKLSFFANRRFSDLPPEAVGVCFLSRPLRAG